MNLEDLPPAELMWEGKFIRAFKRGKWEYASRARDIRAVVILAEHDGKLILVSQPRVAPDCYCVELPAGLVGDHDPTATIEDTAITLGEAFSLALVDKRGMERYGFTLPMDDCLAQVAVDFGGRAGGNKTPGPFRKPDERACADSAAGLPDVRKGCR